MSAPCINCTGEHARVMCAACIVTGILNSQKFDTRDEARALAARLLPDLFPEHPATPDLFSPFPRA